MTRPGASAPPRAADRFRLRRILSVQGEIRPSVVAVIASGTTLLLLLLGMELVVVLLSLANVEVFRYLFGSSVLSWLAHRNLL